MEYGVGVALALGTGLFATLAGFDRERSLYPLMLVVIASYYVLFGVLGGSALILMAEAASLIVFAAIAVIGFRTDLWIVVAALFGHGVFDMVHGHLIADPGVPAWWPGFCLAFDVVIAGYMAWRLSPLSMAPRLASAARDSFAAPIRPLVNASRGKRSRARSPRTQR